MTPQKILLVDDERALSELISEGLLIKGDYDIEKALNGSEALEKYKEFLPDIVVMDIEKPVSLEDLNRTIRENLPACF
jgi:CheY-like chemotaxis protein